MVEVDARFYIYIFNYYIIYIWNYTFNYLYIIIYGYLIIYDYWFNRSKGGLKIREHKTFGVYVDELSKHKVDSYEMIESRINEGNLNRTIGSTLMNQSSSRAHTVIFIELNIKEQLEDRILIKKSNINLVDLAGSERILKSGATGD